MRVFFVYPILSCAIVSASCSHSFKLAPFRYSFKLAPCSSSKLDKVVVKELAKFYNCRSNEL